jgi:hypothetical protein
MKVSSKFRAILAVLLSAMGTTAALLPNDWIEQRFGFSPDGGNGFIEFLWVAVPFALAAVLLVGALRDRRRQVLRT